MNPIMERRQGGASFCSRPLFFGGRYCQEIQKFFTFLRDKLFTPWCFPLDEMKYEHKRVRKHLACTRCRQRKMRCTGPIPCAKCVDAQVECTTTEDKRSIRPSTSEMDLAKAKMVQMELQIDHLLNLNAMLRQRQDGDMASQILPDMNLKQHGAMRQQDQSKYPKPGEFHQIDKDDPEYVWSAYGPTSIFDTALPSASLIGSVSKSKGAKANGAGASLSSAQVAGSGASSSSSSAAFQQQSLTTTHAIQILNRNETILKHVKLFFQYMYPDIHMFIPRETFLIDFHHPRPLNVGNYCTKELVYALCAIGALFDDQFDNHLTADSYYNVAKNRLFLQLDSNVSLPSLQAFILLGLYDIYKGKNESGWILTGLGLRIGFNLGFHLEPTNVSDLTVKFKSRIYWGCYVVDHLLGLIFGRPFVLKLGDSTIEDSKSVPDLEWIKEFNYKGHDEIIDVHRPLQAIVRLFSIVEDAFGDIFKAGKRYGVESSAELVAKLSKVVAFNESVASWRHMLSTDLQWSTDVPQAMVDPIGVKAQSQPKMNHVFVHYLTLLCMNRPFIQRQIDVAETDPSFSEIQLMQSAIMAQTVRCLQDLAMAMCDPAGSPGSILVIYCAVIGVSTTMILGDSQHYPTSCKSKWLVDNELLPQRARARDLRRWFFAFMAVLHTHSTRWPLAARVLQTVEGKLVRLYGIGYGRALAEHERERELRDAPPDPPFADALHDAPSPPLPAFTLSEDFLVGTSDLFGDFSDLDALLGTFMST